MISYPILIFLVLVVVVFLALAFRSSRTSVRYSIPRGSQIYGDLISEGKTMRSTRYQISGKPDKVVLSGRQIVPYEYKSTMADRPREGHMLQMGAYFIILEELYPDKQMPYGIIKYGNNAFRIDNTSRLKAAAVEVANQIRGNFGIPTRNHANRGKCFKCGFRDNCLQSLIR